MWVLADDRRDMSLSSARNLGKFSFPCPTGDKKDNSQGLGEVETILWEPPSTKRGDTGTGTKVNAETEELSFVAEEMGKIQPEGRESRGKKKKQDKACWSLTKDVWKETEWEG